MGKQRPKKPANSQQRTVMQKLTGRPFNTTGKNKLPQPDQVVGMPKNRIYTSEYREPVPRVQEPGGAFPTASGGQGWSKARLRNGKVEGVDYFNADGRRISRQKFLELYGK